MGIQKFPLIKNRGYIREENITVLRENKDEINEFFLYFESCFFFQFNSVIL